MESGCVCCAGKKETHKVYTVRMDNVRYEDERVLKKALEQNYGVCSVKVDLFQGVLVINYNPEKISLAEVRQVLTLPNFILDRTVKRWVGSLIEKHGDRMQLISTAILIVTSWGLLVTTENFKLPNPVYIALTMLIILIGGFSTFKSGFTSLYKRKLNVSVLITIAAISAIAIGDWLEAASVLFIAVIGEALERTSLKNTNKNIFSTLILGARSAFVKDGDKFVELPVHKVRKGQIVQVRQGMKIPVDGVITTGSAQINEAAITGESAFRSKRAGDKVFTGTILEYGMIEMEAMNVGNETTLSQIGRMVEKARDQKTDSEKIVDKFASYFIPVILVVAILVFIGNLLFDIPFKDSLERSLTILIVACPCALVLATPTAVNAGVGRAARSGIIFKNGSIMEQLVKVKTILLDKTGTLTYARPRVVGIKTFGNFGEDELLRATAFVENKSQHPLAVAISQYVKDKSIVVEEPEKFMEFEGGGACAISGDKHVKVGALWLMDDGKDIPDEVLQWRDESQKLGYTCVFVANKEFFMGGIIIEDEIREDAISTLELLKAEGIQNLIMATGDNTVVANRVGAALHIDEVVAECMPDTKLKKIRSEQQKGVLVGMVGDGINDAPALAAADVGIAMGAIGSEAAVAAGDVSLMHNNLRGLLFGVRIAKMTLRTIKLNIFFSVAVNVIAVGLASIGSINMLMGAVLHQASALTVIFNSMLLFFRNPEK